MENSTSTSQNDVSPQNVRPVSWPEVSQETLIKVSKQNLSHKFPRKWKRYFYIALGMFIAITFFSSTVFLALRKRNSANLCTSPECVRSASNLLQSMNDSVDPCDNFYKFSCDNWRKEHLMDEPRFMNNWFEERGRIIKRDVLEYLEQENSEDEPIPVYQARTMYDACLDFESINANGIDALWDILNTIGLPQLPFVSDEPAQDWVRSMAKIRRHLNMEVLVGFSVMTSLRNSTVNQLAVTTTAETDVFLRRKWANFETDETLEKSIKSGNGDVIRLWKNFSIKLMKFLVEKTNYTDPNLDRNIAKASLRILQIQQNLTKIENSEDVMGPYINDIPDEMELSQLQELVDNSSITGQSKLIWETYFESLFEDVEGVELNFPDDQILVYKRVYFEMLSENMDYLSEKDLELFLWWEVVYALAAHVHEDLKTMKDAYTSKVLSTARADSRQSECATLVYFFMDSAVGYMALSRVEYELISTISDMLSNIQEAFTQSIDDLLWMDEPTKKETIKKIQSIRKFIGIPDWIADKEELESMYNITVSDTTHLANLLEIVNAQVMDTFVSLREENNRTISQFNPLDINAYYDPSGNAISVPVAILQFPFYDLGLESLNYGALGSILGHEITHALDSYGRLFDLDGNLNDKWWTNNSLIEYEKRTECFVDTYSNFYIPLVNGSVNGNTTLAENLADDGGLRNAFLAYRMFTHNFDYVEPKLPGLERFSQKQLFFMSHANMWCSEYTDESLSETIDYDEHSPQFVRVNRVMQNMPEFAKAWNCPLGSNMNPERKCKLWLD